MTQTFDCTDEAARASGIAAAVSAVRCGRLVVLPTDTVYGVGADAFDPAAVAALLAAKGRGRDMPVPVLVGSWHTIDGLAFAVPDAARELIRAFWPGALSIVVAQAPSLQWDLGEGHGTVMVRMPLHPVAIELLREVGPMAVSSANISGQPPAVTADEARRPAGRPRRGLPRCRAVSAAGCLDDRRPQQGDSAHPARGARHQARDRRCAGRRRRHVDGLIFSLVQYGFSVVTAADSMLALSERGAGVPLRELALVGLAAAIITYFCTGWVRVLAMRLGAVAYPRERDVHVQPTPRMGGLGDVHRGAGGGAAGLAAARTDARFRLLLGNARRSGRRRNHHGNRPD